MIPTALRSFTDRKSRLELTGATVGQLLSELADTYPDIKQHLFDDEGEPRSFINVFVGERNIRELSGMATPVGPDAQVMLVPAIAGGGRGQ
jgi:molybdopterin converting factor small subunit